MNPSIINFTIEQALVVGIVTGVFSAGTIYGILKSELKNLSDDISEIKSDYKDHVKNFHMKGNEK